MNDVTHILEELGHGTARAADELLPLVYTELRQLAAARLAHERPGQTLNATALVHEAYLRLVQGEQAKHWQNRGHFFAAAAEAMRRLLVEQARRKAAQRRAGMEKRIDLDQLAPAQASKGDELLAIHEALAALEMHDEPAARLVKLRYFAGLNHQEAAEAMGLSRGEADGLWAMARAWLYQEINGKS
jgi:RNA polymerase sigma factor (TIGR02999 family)